MSRALFIGSFIALGTGLAIAAKNTDGPLAPVLLAGIAGYLAVLTMVPRVSQAFINIGLKGNDRLKKNRPLLPECMGLVAATTYLMLMVLLIPFVFFKYLAQFDQNEFQLTETYLNQYHAVNTWQFPHNQLAAYLSAVLCLLSTTMLGLFDDLFDIRWRHKFFIPAIASLPIIIVYYVDFSVTVVAIPKFLRGSLLVRLLEKIVKFANVTFSEFTGLQFGQGSNDGLVDLGILYYVYMSAVSIFAPNSINILAGINGLEVGQSVVLGLVLLINDSFYVFSDVTQAAHDAHLFSILFIIPFLGVSIALLQLNWYPAKVFVGDTYCYFAGMVFAIVGILGHFSKTLLLFLLPQIINFIYGLPQLFLIVPCPRHRMPNIDEKTGLLHPSYGQVENPGLYLSTLKFLKLVHLEKEDTHYRFSNLTIINLILVWTGPIREDCLCKILLCINFFVGLFMVFMRHTFGPWLFGYDNLSFGVK